MVALAALALSLYFTVRPVYAGGVAELQESQKGTDSSEATDDCAGAGKSVPAGEVLWHFILNGLDPGITSAISGHFEFDSAGTVDVSSSKWNKDGTTHHFYVFTTGDDILLDATADIGDSSYNVLTLSHICHGGETGQSVEESASASESAEQSVEASASGEQSVEAGTGTPAESTVDSSFFGAASSALPTILFSLILLASLGTLAYANVKTVRSRN
jgi:hypothetical protein